MKSIVLAASLLNSGLSPKATEQLCLSLYGAYLTGCTEEYANKGLNPEQVRKVVDNCSKKSLIFIKNIDMCRNLDWDK
jgi:hypothetical protein